MRGRPFGSRKRFNITYESISEVTGLSINTLMKYIYRDQFDPNNLSSLVDFIIKRRKKLKAQASKR